MMLISNFFRLHCAIKKFRSLLSYPIFLFVGDGGRADAGAASGPGGSNRDLTGVRTRQDLVAFINMAADPVAVKQEIINDAQDSQTELMDFDDPENFLEVLEPDMNATFGESEGEEDEEGGVVVYEQEEGGEAPGDGSDYVEDEESGGEEGEETEGGAAAGGDRQVRERGRTAASLSILDTDGGQEKMEVGLAARASKVEPGAAVVMEESATPNMTAGSDEVAAAAVAGADSETRGERVENAGQAAGGVMVEEEDVREEETEDRLDNSLKPTHLYHAVRSLLAGAMEPRKLNKRMKVVYEESGFCQSGDERWYRNQNISSMERRVNVSASFTDSGWCHTCLTGRHEAWRGKEGQPVVIVAGDQHFPANLPANGKGECIRIMRVENGSLSEISHELIKRMPRGGAVAGTVVMLGSAVQLGVESVAFYAAEWKKYRNILKRELGDIIVIPLLHLTPVGIEERTILRGLIDMAAWVDDLEEIELRLIRNTRMNFFEVNLGRLDRGPGWADYHVNSRMPVSLAEDSTGTTAYVTGDWGKRPLKVGPLTESGEKYWVGLLIGEINRELKLGLATAVSFGRTLSAVKRVGEDVGKMSAVTVGASNAARTAAALKRKGVETVPLGQAGWKISEDSIAYLENELSGHVARAEFVVLHCLDSSVFYALEKSGAMSVPATGQDGVHHVLGKVVVARGLQLEILLETVEPVLRLRSDLLTFLVCPTIRHVEACCTAHDFMNAEERRVEGERQLRELGSLRREVKTWLIKKGYSNTLLVDPLQASAAAADIDKAREIMRDTVHMKPAGFSKLAEKIKEMAKCWLLNKKRVAHGGAEPESKRARLDTSLGRKGGGGSSGGEGGSWGATAGGGGGIHQSRAGGGKLSK
jgi:hypothetical protein